jgi:hypothetical protein
MKKIVSVFLTCALLVTAGIASAHVGHGVSTTAGLSATTSKA